MHNIKSVIFDVDGTLLDSMCIWENVAADYLESRGITPQPDLYDHLLMIGGHEIPRYFRAEYGLPDSEEKILHGIYKLLEDFYLRKVPLKKGVTRVLGALRERGIQMNVATATDRWLVEPALQRCGILDYFECVFTCSEERTSKNSPDIYLRAAANLGTAASDTLVVEDALYAIKSAKSAGFPVAAVYDRSAGDQQVEIKKFCDYYFTSLDEMLDLLQDQQAITR